MHFTYTAHLGLLVTTVLTKNSLKQLERVDLPHQRFRTQVTKYTSPAADRHILGEEMF